ncbi:hypothetical protein [Streptomyces vastus]|uniref:hypothetical protein n=1 Tax=Streptomyces vastus TaxID=285451 RepID=UPI0031E06BDD
MSTARLRPTARPMATILATLALAATSTESTAQALTAVRRLRHHRRHAAPSNTQNLRSVLGTPCVRHSGQRLRRMCQAGCAAECSTWVMACAGASGV